MNDGIHSHDVSDRLRLIEETAAFEQHRVDQMHQQVLALQTRVDELHRRLESLERRLSGLAQRAQGAEDDRPPDGAE